jgi:hypothetical protein
MDRPRVACLFWPLARCAAFGFLHTVIKVRHGFCALVPYGLNKIEAVRGLTQGAQLWLTNR